MEIKTRRGIRNVAVLIPSRQRASVVAQQLRKMPFLNTPSTFYGVDRSEHDQYMWVLAGTQVRVVLYDNVQHSVGFCREELRQVGLAARRPKYDTFIVTDDNTRFDESALVNLVRAQAEWSVQPCVMTGRGILMEHFAGSMSDLQTRYGLRSFQTVTQQPLAIPRELYQDFRYPAECLAAEDRYFTMWCFQRGMTAWRTCLDASYAKSRQQPGGTGSVEERMRATGLGLAKLAQDFPVYVGCTGSTPIKWKYVLKLAQGYTFSSRLPGGGARQTEDVIAASMVRTV
jgi:hypothetical protein